LLRQFLQSGPHVSEYAFRSQCGRPPVCSGKPVVVSSAERACLDLQPENIACPRDRRKGYGMKTGFCHHCGEPLEFAEKVFRNDTCKGCGSDVYCCLNCTEYDETAPNQCREPQAETVAVKDRRNFCDYFKLQEGRRSSAARDKAAEARAKLEELFKKSK
jgi:hypothetical protein